jgi:hypothetical protein
MEVGAQSLGTISLRHQLDLNYLVVDIRFLHCLVKLASILDKKAPRRGI